MIKTSLVIEGLEDLAKDMDALHQEKLKPAAGRAVKRHADKVLKTARDLCPEDEGLLKESLHVTVSKDGQRVVVKTDPVKAPHGHLIHFGTSRMAGRPFLYQASERHAGELHGEIEKEIDAEL